MMDWIYRSMRRLAVTLAAAVLVSGGAALADELVLPAELTAIEKEAFYADASLETVILPEGVLNIGARAFADSSLQRINLPASVAFIADDAFGGLEQLEVTAVEGTYAYQWAVDNGFIMPAASADLFTYSAPVNDCVSITGFADKSSYPEAVFFPHRSPDGYEITAIADSAFRNCGELKTVIVPSNIKSIAASAFQNCAQLTRLVLSEGLEAIKGTVNYDNGAFSGCVMLESVTIPSTVKEIGNYAFHKCTALTKVNILDSTECTLTIGANAFSYSGLSGELMIPSKVSTVYASAFESTPIAKLSIEEGSLTAIGEKAFMSCAELTEATIPANVLSIESKAFQSCVKLVKVKLSEGLEAIKGTVNYDNGAFSGCVMLESVTIPSTVKEIGNYAFHKCTALTKVNILDSEACTLTIGANAFSYSGLTGELKIPSKVSAVYASAFESTPIAKLSIEAGTLTAIGERAFMSCAELTEATIPGNVKSIESKAFQSCVKLVKVNLSEGLEAIKGTVNYDNGAFSGCVMLESVTIPSTVKEIGNYAFHKCTALTKVDILDSAECTLTIGANAFSYSGLTGELKIPSKVSAVYASAFESTPIAKLSIEEGALTAIGEKAFMNCAELTEATIPANVLSIESNAFQNCVKLVEVNLSEGLEAIKGTVNYDNGAFSGCVMLESVTIPSTVKEIGNYAFHKCTALTKVDILDSTECMLTIGANAFSYSGLTGELKIPSKVSAVNTSAFENTLIAKLSIEEGALTAIGERAFMGCAELTEATIPANVLSIESKTFQNCMKLVKVNLSEGLEAIKGTVNYDNGAFSGCVMLESVTIPSTVKEIGNYAFHKCTALTKVDILDSEACTLTIGANAFSFSGLTGELKIPSKVSAVYASAFESTPIGRLNIEAGALTAIGERAFMSCAELTEATIPANVLSIESKAFQNCLKLVKVNLSEGLEAIKGTVNFDNGAFSGCISLESVTIPSTVKEIGNYAFHSCKALTKVDILDSTECTLTIGANAFSFSGLTGELKIPSKVSAVNTSAFENTPVGKLTIEEGALTAIGDKAFKDCGLLETVFIPGNVKTVGAKAFNNCVLLNSLTLSEGVEKLADTVNYDNGAFSGCVSLTSVTIPSTLTYIGNYSFYNCTSLAEIIIENAAENVKIGNNAFVKCPGSPVFTVQ